MSDRPDPRDFTGRDIEEEDDGLGRRDFLKYGALGVGGVGVAYGAFLAEDRYDWLGDTEEDCEVYAINSEIVNQQNILQDQELDPGEEGYFTFAYDHGEEEWYAVDTRDDGLGDILDGDMYEANDESVEQVLENISEEYNMGQDVVDLCNSEEL